jgi:hypothetical protein
LRVTFTVTGRRSPEVFDDLLAATGWRPVSATRLLLKSGAFAISASLPQVAPRKKANFCGHMISGLFSCELG